jgi:hypothetical protein
VWSRAHRFEDPSLSAGLLSSQQTALFLDIGCGSCPCVGGGPVQPSGGGDEAGGAPDQGCPTAQEAGRGGRYAFQSSPR